MDYTSDEICRDWTRNTCDKGDLCRYKHPPKDLKLVLEQSQICLDFQGPKDCSWSDCKYLHITKQEEMLIRDNLLIAEALTTEQRDRILGQPPICNDFAMKGKCSRGANCKYRHIRDSKELLVSSDPYALPHAGDGDREVCRDWLRNTCSKGDSCRYKHPPQNLSLILERNQVCHDFQNPAGCNRSTCKFLHVTKQEEKQIRDNLLSAESLSPSQRDRLLGLPPVCNDFKVKGKCSRGGNCKFRHVGDGIDEDRVRRSSSRSRYDPYARPDDLYDRYRRDPYDPAPLERYRRSYAEDILEDENAYLRAQLDRLRRQVADLTAANDILLEQNAKLRISAREPVRSVSISSSLTPVVSPGISDIYSSDRARRPSSQVMHQQSTLSHQLALNSELAHRATLSQQRVAQDHSGSATGVLAPGNNLSSLPVSHPPVHPPTYSHGDRFLEPLYN